MPTFDPLTVSASQRISFRNKRPRQGNDATVRKDNSKVSGTCHYCGTMTHGKWEYSSRKTDEANQQPQGNRQEPTQKQKSKLQLEMSKQIVWKHRLLRMRFQTQSQGCIRFPQCTSCEKELMKTKNSVEVSFHRTNELHSMKLLHNANSPNWRGIVSKLITLRHAQQIYTSLHF